MVTLSPWPRPLLLLRNSLLPPLHCLPGLPSAHALKSSLQHCPLLFAFFQKPRPLPRQPLRLLLFIQLGERRSFEVSPLLVLQQSFRSFESSLEFLRGGECVKDSTST